MDGFVNVCDHCEQAVEVGKGTTGCPYCGAIYHETCWEEHFGCADQKCVGYQMHRSKTAEKEGAATFEGTIKNETFDVSPWQIFVLAWEKIRKRLGFFIGIQFVISLILVTLALIGEKTGSTGLRNLIFTLYPFISAYFGVASLNIYILEHDGKNPGIKEIFNAPNYWRMMWSSFLVGLAVSAGTVLLVLPGLFLAIALLFAPFLILDQNATIKEAFTRSYKMTVGNFWKVAGVLGLGLLVNILGALLVGLGLLVSLPVTIMAFVVLYRKML